MKAYLSALAPAARLTVWKTLLIALGAAAVQAVLFFLTLSRWGGETPLILESLIQEGRLSLVFAAGLLLVCGALVLPGWDRGAKTGYTIRRLTVNEGKLSLLWGVQNALLLFFYWVCQMAAVLVLGVYFLSCADPATVSHQSLLLACYRSPYLHSLLPLADWLVLLRNLSGCLVLGLAAAAFCHHRRHGRTSPLILPLAVVAAVGFPVYAGNPVLSISVTVIFLLLCLYFWKSITGVSEDEE